MRPRVRHELKCWPEFFRHTVNGSKRFELRRDDRPEGFQVGDELLLREWNPEPTQSCVVQGYTGREVLVRVDYIMDAETLEILMQGSNQRFFTDNPPCFVVMSVSRVH